MVYSQLGQPAHVSANQDSNDQRAGDDRKKEEHGLSGCGEFGHCCRCLLAQAGITKVSEAKADQRRADKKDTCRHEYEGRAESIVERTCESHATKQARLGEKKAAGHHSSPDVVGGLALGYRDQWHKVNRTGCATGEEENQGGAKVPEESSKRVGKAESSYTQKDQHSSPVAAHELGSGEGAENCAGANNGLEKTITGGAGVQALVGEHNQSREGHTHEQGGHRCERHGGSQRRTTRD